MRATQKMAGLFLALIAGSVFISAAHASSRHSYFVMSEERSRDLKPFPKWTKMVSRFVDQRAIPDNQCDKVTYHPCVIKEWKALIDRLAGESLMEQLRRVNEWGNQHPYIVDQINWGTNDYWETPYEFMSVSGDCEDYAIAKYYTLRALGYGDDRMRVMIVQDFNLGGIIHAVLGFYDDQKQLWILDNQITQMMPALGIYHYRPIYGINETAWWAYTPVEQGI